METIIKLRLSEDEILADSNVFLSAGEASISNAETIKNGGVSDNRIATFEPNFWVLDDFSFCEQCTPLRLRCG